MEEVLGLLMLFVGVIVDVVLNMVRSFENGTFLVGICSV